MIARCLSPSPHQEPHLQEEPAWSQPAAIARERRSNPSIQPASPSIIGPSIPSHPSIPSIHPPDHPFTCWVSLARPCPFSPRFRCPGHRRQVGRCRPRHDSSAARHAPQPRQLERLCPRRRNSPPSPSTHSQPVVAAPKTRRARQEAAVPGCPSQRLLSFLVAPLRFFSPLLQLPLLLLHRRNLIWQRSVTFLLPSRKFLSPNSTIRLPFPKTPHRVFFDPTPSPSPSVASRILFCLPPPNAESILGPAPIVFLLFAFGPGSHASSFWRQFPAPKVLPLRRPFGLDWWPSRRPALRTRLRP